MPKYALEPPSSIVLVDDMDLDSLMRRDFAQSEQTEAQTPDRVQSPAAARYPRRGASMDSIDTHASEEMRCGELLVLPIKEPIAPELSPWKQLPVISGKSAASPGRVRIRDVRVFCNFLTQDKGKKQSFNVRLRDQGIRGIDVVEATIKAFMSSDERLQSKFSSNTMDYRLYLADDQTGVEETRIQLDSPCGNFSCLALVPNPNALLSLFPQRKDLLPPCVSDVTFQVEVRGSVAKHSVVFPADLPVDRLENAVFKKLPIKDPRKGSLRIKYGPVELHSNEKYDFGKGCGTPDLTVGERTLVSIFRFGVTDIIVEGTMAETPDPGIQRGDSAVNLFVRMDEEEARAYQQFEVVKINKYGVRQDRVIGVDGDRIYNMRPSTEIGKTKNPERNIVDIEAIRGFPERPNYCEIEYKRSARFDTDKIECKNALECSKLLEKLRTLKKMHERRSLEKQGESAIGKFFSKFGFGK